MIVEVETDYITGDLIVPLPDCPWAEGTEVVWINNDDGTWTLRPTTKYEKYVKQQLEQEQ